MNQQADALSKAETPIAPTEGSNITRDRRPQLDGLRAIACAAVMFSHFAPEEWLLQRMLPWGTMGVHLFLVLSGFLITAILLDSRERATGHGAVSNQLKQFYVRRFLRIFPLYYALLFTLYLLNYGIMRDTFTIHLLYLQNLWRCFENVHFINHLWTLAVEEQFYLLWPWAVLFLPRRALPHAMFALIAIAMLCRLTAWTLETSYLYLNIFTLSNLDTLGAGAFLAWRWRTNESQPISPATARLMVASGVGLLLMIGYLSLCHPTERNTLLLILGSASVLLFVPLIDAAARGTTGQLGVLLNLPPLVYLGKISYGLYVLHPFVETLYDHVSTQTMLPQFWLIRIPLLAAASILLAALSWHLFEYPINKLKRYFPYAA